MSPFDDEVHQYWWDQFLKAQAILQRGRLSRRARKDQEFWSTVYRNMAEEYEEKA